MEYSKNNSLPKHTFFLSLLLFFLSTPNIYSQRNIMNNVFNEFYEIENLQLVNSWIDSDCRLVDVVKNKALINNGKFVEVLDLSTPSNPVSLVKIPMSTKISDIKIFGKEIYISTGRELKIIGGELPYFKINEINLNDDISEFYVEGPHLFILTFDKGLIVYDIENIENIKEISRYAIGYDDFCYNDCVSYDFVINDNIVFIGNEYLGIKVLDYSNVSSPREIGVIKIQNGTIDLAMQNNLLYSVTYDSVYVYNVTNPKSPKKLHQIKKERYSYSKISIENNEAYIINGPLHLQLIEINNGNINIKKLFKPKTSFEDVDCSNGLLYLSDKDSGLEIYNTKDNQLIGNHETGFYSGSNSIYMTENKLFHTRPDGWFGIVDISGADLVKYNYKNSSSYNQPEYYLENSNTIFFRDGHNSISVYQLSDFKPPKLLQKKDFIYLNSSAYEDNLMFVIDSRKLIVFDISDPLKFKELDSIELEGYQFENIRIDGDKLYVDSEFKKIIIIDKSDPRNLSIEPNNFAPEYYFKLTEVYNGIAYVNNYDELFIVDFSDPLNPQLLCNYSNQNFTVEDIAIKSTELFVNTGQNSILMFDISDLMSPIEIGHFKIKDSHIIGFPKQKIFVFDEKIFAILGDYGFFELSTINKKRNSKFSNIKHSQEKNISNYPNPFNPSTIISFHIERQEEVKINVYNSLGEEIQELYNGYLESGFHELNFDAGNLSSGIYYYRIQYRDQNFLNKMIIVK